MSDLDRILRLAGLATTADESVATPTDRELKEYGEEGCECCGGGRCTCPGDCPDCNCHGNNDWDESVEEAEKPDFRDVDGDGVTEESWKDAEEDNKKIREAEGEGTYARVSYEYSEDWGSIDLYKNHEKVDEWDGYFGANETGNPLARKFVEMCKEHGFDPMSLPLVDENGDIGKFDGKSFEWEDSVSEEETLEEMEVVSEAPTMDTTQLINLMRLSGINEEIIKQKLDEWANTPEGVGEVEPTVHGGDDNYAFAQSVNLSLKRYLDAQDMKVQVKEHTVEDMKALYESKKNSK